MKNRLRRRGHGPRVRGAEDSPPPVAEEGEPQAGENRERAERSKRRQATMFSTGPKARDALAGVGLTASEVAPRAARL